MIKCTSSLLSVLLYLQDDILMSSKAQRINCNSRKMISYVGGSIVVEHLLNKGIKLK